jgi:hypothetical protein
METKLTEMLSDVPGATVRALEQGGTLTVQVVMVSSYDALREGQLRERLAAIAVEIEFVFTGA